MARWLGSHLDMTSKHPKIWLLPLFALGLLLFADYVSIPDLLGSILSWIAIAILLAYSTAILWSYRQERNAGSGE